MGRIQRQFVILLTAATIITGISTVAMLMPQAVYASDDDNDDEDCASDELPASIDGTIRCMGQGECYSEQFKHEGKGVKHCNSMMADE